jgi:XTP/dITP diphosphohydrolase
VTGGGPGRGPAGGPPRRRIVLATRNTHKVMEIAEALALPDVELVGLDAFPDAPDVEEDGRTFRANAEKKAKSAAEATGLPALADDSGLIVDALGGEPGVLSARFAGAGAGDAANRAKLRRRMAGVPAAERTARFVCVLALAEPGGRVRAVEGRCEGTLLEQERGDGGFGYDPFFVPEGETRTFAEMSRAEKAILSHRGRAIAAVRPLLAGLPAGREAGSRGRP